MSQEAVVIVVILAIAAGWIAAEVRVRIADQRVRWEREDALRRLEVERAAALEALQAERARGADILAALLEVHRLHARQMAILHRLPPSVWAMRPETDALAKIHDDLAAALQRGISPPGGDEDGTERPHRR